MQLLVRQVQISKQQQINVHGKWPHVTPTSHVLKLAKTLLLSRVVPFAVPDTAKLNNIFALDLEQLVLIGIALNRTLLIIASSLMVNSMSNLAMMYLVPLPVFPVTAETMSAKSSSMVKSKKNPAQLLYGQLGPHVWPSLTHVLIVQLARATDSLLMLKLNTKIVRHLLWLVQNGPTGLIGVFVIIIQRVEHEIASIQTILL
jgi:hypothetical protein